MYDKSEITAIIFECIDDINQQEKLNIPKDTKALLFGRGGHLDSLGLVNLIVAVEEKVNEKYDTAISLVDEKAMSQKSSPFMNVESLVNYIMLLEQ